MNFNRMLFLIGAGVLVSGIGACSSADNSTAINYAVRQYPDADRVELVRAAVNSMKQSGFRVGRYEPDAARIVSDPVFDHPRDSNTSRPPRLSTESRLRRIAEVRVATGDDPTRLYCRVLVQEQTTQAHRMLSMDQSGGDVPSDTPIDREAATTERQNTVWKTVRRDRIAEREILSLVEASMKGQESETE